MHGCLLQFSSDNFFFWLFTDSLTAKESRKTDCKKGERKILIKQKCFRSQVCKQGTVIYSYNSNTREAEAGGFLLVAGQPLLGNRFYNRQDYTT